MPAIPHRGRPIRRRLAAAGPPVQPEAIQTDFPVTYRAKPAIPKPAIVTRLTVNKR
jgi:hypothetical protein